MAGSQSPSGGELRRGAFPEEIEEALPLVNYDCRIIPLLLESGVEAGRDHGGRDFSGKIISPADIVSQVRTLSKLVREAGNWEWTNRVCFFAALIGHVTPVRPPVFT